MRKEKRERDQKGGWFLESNKRWLCVCVRRKKKKVVAPGIEPGTFALSARRTTNCATSPFDFLLSFLLSSSRSPGFSFSLSRSSVRFTFSFSCDRGGGKRKKKRERKRKELEKEMEEKRERGEGTPPTRKASETPELQVERSKTPLEERLEREELRPTRMFHCALGRCTRDPLPQSVQRTGMRMVAMSWLSGLIAMPIVVVLVLAGAQLHSGIMTGAFVFAVASQLPSLTGTVFGITKNRWMGVVHIVVQSTTGAAMTGGMVYSFAVWRPSDASEVCVRQHLLPDCSIAWPLGLGSVIAFFVAFDLFVAFGLWYSWRLWRVCHAWSRITYTRL